MSKYSLIKNYLKKFEQTLDENHEMALIFPSYGGPYLLQITETGGDEYIAFEMLSDSGEKLAVIQDYSQLNFSVVSRLKPDAQKPARRLGYTAD